jgi:hypothetical protein
MENSFYFKSSNFDNLKKFLFKVATINTAISIWFSIEITEAHSFGRDEACYGNDFPSILLLIWTYVCGLEQNNMFIYRKA